MQQYTGCKSWLFHHCCKYVLLKYFYPLLSLANCYFDYITTLRAGILKEIDSIKKKEQLWM